MKGRRLLKQKRRAMPQLEDAAGALADSTAKNLSRHNVVSLNLRVIKEHVLRQDTFGYGYLVTTVDMVVDLLINSRRGMALPIPMELMKIFSAADEQLKMQRNPKSKPDSLKEFVRNYVRLWVRLFHYIEKRFDTNMAEHIMIEAYNRISTKNHYRTLKMP